MNTKCWTLHFPHNLPDELPDPTAEGSKLTLQVRYDNGCIDILYNSTPLERYNNINIRGWTSNDILHHMRNLGMHNDFKEEDLDNLHIKIREFIIEEGEYINENRSF